jgi:vacuolar-type H+-ATPase subunit D/Vma8
LNNKYTEVLKLKEDLDYAELVRVSESINRYHEKIIQYAKGQYDKYNNLKPVELPGGNQQEEEKKGPNSEVKRNLF